MLMGAFSKTGGNEGEQKWNLKRQTCMKLRLRPRHKASRAFLISSSLGLFILLPTEVLHMILDQLSALEISVFCMASKEITELVMDYISTHTWNRKSIIQPFHRSTSLEKGSDIQHSSELGVLFKRCTLLLPTKDRLKFVFSKFSQMPCFMLEQCEAPFCSDFTSYGVFLQTLISGWDELECNRVFSFLCQITNLQQKTEAVLSDKPGAKNHQELQLRLFCRQVFLDPWFNQPECQFWIIQLLQPWQLVSQARLLYILYGPQLHVDRLGWQDLVDAALPSPALQTLAQVIQLLFGKLQAKGWTTDSMMTIFEELIVIPEPWQMENVARLLVLCGSCLTYNFLASKALNGRLAKLSRVIVFIILVCEKDGYHMSWAVKLVQEICKVIKSAQERFSFVTQLESTFSSVIREFIESSVAENRIEDPDYFQTLCILLNASARFHTKLLHNYLKK